VITVNWTRTSDPAVEPITVAEAKAQANVTHTDQDDLFASYIAAAREEAEDYLGRGLYTQTWELTLSDWADEIQLPMAAPLQSISSVKYYDADGTLQTLSSSYYITDTVARPAALLKAPDQTWPALQADRRGWRVKVTYIVGWSSATSIPERIKHGIRMFVTYLYESRGDVMEPGARDARLAAFSCWSDRVPYTPPRCW